MSEKDVTIMRDGLKLAAKVSIPDSEEYDLAILAYGFVGMMDPKVNDLLPVIAEKLQEKGLATVRFDFNGHGLSEGPLDNMSIFNELEDYEAVMKYVSGLKGVKKIYLIGHSQGAVLSSMMAGFYADKISKLVLMSPAATLVDDARIGTCMGEEYDPNAVPDKLDFGDFKLNGWYFRTAKFINIYDTAAAYRGPVLVLHGEDDKIVNNYAGRHYQAIYDDCEFHLISGSDHGLHQNRDEVYDRVLNFLTD
ncbi:alpha/beta hydrolase [Lactobacillus nasalidis]|uniref:Alpha/beta hydrolase n=1 Tax=Lactobacillus nasalidis TaxID=2797258 RepID=A0ABQ3W4Q8_9LACO|nr:alpha/beta fold hydrolase [Lactobacillus nasalidis]GHV98379.1 alpha/beta hydrolase [Lactobacillus nasalidis]GHV99537.1 alpha/beta hydrolase [Lactobacillus nasalidis]GHW00507.1 alpha/beta hydrolase [Lactobacillus nasalidis]